LPTAPAARPPLLYRSTARNVQAFRGQSRIDAFCTAFQALRRKSMAIKGRGG